MYLSVPSSREVSLYELILDQFSNQVNHDGKRCSNCCPHGDTICPGTFQCESMPLMEKRHIKDYPEVLFIQLKRFQQNNFLGPISKIQTHVVVNETIMFGSMNYRLKGILNHFGTYTEGHYTSAIKHDNKWFLFDDFKQPKFIEGKELFNSGNYLFVYEKTVKMT